jgi:hypothetical protein
MRSIRTSHHPDHRPRLGDGIHPALQSFADECSAVAARLLAYMGVLAFLVMGGISVFNHLEFDIGDGPAARTGWSPATRPKPAFAVGQFDSATRTAIYDVQRHAEGGGRKDILRWQGPGETPLAELQLYRPGSEAAGEGAPAAELAHRLDPAGTGEAVGEGFVDSKFGPVALLSAAAQARDGKRCLGYFKSFEGANLRLSGWSCQGDSLPARRAGIACTLNRLVLLTAGNEPKLQELFTQAELKRTTCASGAALATTAADWATGAQSPTLRGSL